MKLPRTVAAFAVLIVGGAHAAQFPASSDATISMKKAGKKLGGAKTLVVDKSSNALLQFDLTSMPLGTKADHVARATLRLWLRDNPKPGVIAVGVLANAFVESDVSGSTSPGFVPTGVTAVLPTQGSTFLDLDVTAVVKSWVDGSAPNNGIVLTPEIAGNALKAVFDSRENTQTGHEPTLQVELRNVPTFRYFTFSVPAASWGTPLHYGDNNIHAAFEITPNLVGGIELAQFHSSGGVILIHAAPSPGYTETKALPYTWSKSNGSGGYFGVRLEYLVTRRSLVISKTSNGWDSQSLTPAELPANINVRVTLIGNAAQG